MGGEATLKSDARIRRLGSRPMVHAARRDIDSLSTAVTHSGLHHWSLRAISRILACQTLMRVTPAGRASRDLSTRKPFCCSLSLCPFSLGTASAVRGRKWWHAIRTCIQCSILYEREQSGDPPASAARRPWERRILPDWMTSWRTGTLLGELCLAGVRLADWANSGHHHGGRDISPPSYNEPASPTFSLLFFSFFLSKHLIHRN